MFWLQRGYYNNNIKLKPVDGFPHSPHRHYHNIALTIINYELTSMLAECFREKVARCTLGRMLCIFVCLRIDLSLKKHIYFFGITCTPCMLCFQMFQVLH